MYNWNFNGMDSVCKNPPDGWDANCKWNTRPNSDTYTKWIWTVTNLLGVGQNYWGVSDSRLSAEMEAEKCLARESKPA